MRTFAHGFNRFRSGEALMINPIKIQLSKIEKNTIDPEMLAFAAPIKCIHCYFNDYIPTQFYLVTPGVETYDEHDELSRIVRGQLGHNKFTSMYCDLGDVICVTRCPQCGSEDVF